MKHPLNFLYDYVFPTFILPNALIPEYAILNYMNSQYSTEHTNNCFTDPNATNVSTSVFNNKLGWMWPNSIRHSGGNIMSPLYTEEIIEINEQPLYFGRKIYPKYVYPISITPLLDEFACANLRPGNKLNGEYFWKHMSLRALEDAQQGRALIFIDYGQENFIEKETYESLNHAIKLSGIPKEQIVLAFNTFNGRELYESWFSPEEQRLTVCNWPHVMGESSRFYATNPDRRLTVDRFHATEDTKRKNYFLFKIRNNRHHRIALLYKLVSDNLLDKGDWSCLTKLEFNEATTDYYSKIYQFEFDIEAVKTICNLTPHVLQSEPAIRHESVSAWTDDNTKPHIDSYFYICTETFVHGEHKSLTEKVFKPIANFQPFLFVAYPGALALLRRLGFRTFSPFINESYDDEPNEGNRLNMIYKEITRLCAMTTNEIHAWYWSMKDIMIHNHTHLLAMYKNNPPGKELINYLKQGAGYDL